MKKALFFLLVGAAAGAYGFFYLQRQETEKAAAEKEAAQKAEHAGKSPTLSERVRSDVKAATDAVAAKFTEWHLTPDEIGKELDRTGQVVRTKATSVGDSVASTASNARIVTTIKAKYALDKELSARAIEIDCDKGHVTLRGNVASPTLIAKAIGLALETEGVQKVQSLLAVAAEKS